MAAASVSAYENFPKPVMPRLSGEQFENLVPKVVGNWRFLEDSGVILPPPDALRDRTYDNLVSRVYVSPSGLGVMVVIAYKNVQDGILQVHRPEVCYPASGFTLEAERPISLELAGAAVPAKAFTARREGRVEQVLYYTRMGGEYPLSWADQRLAVLKANLDGEIPDGLLVRVSMIEASQAAAIPVLQNFLAALVTVSPPALAEILLYQRKKLGNWP